MTRPDILSITLGILLNYCPCSEVYAGDGPVRRSTPDESKGKVTKAPIAPVLKHLPIKGEVFTVAGCTAFLIAPTQTKPDCPTPWVWYAPTLSAYPGVHEKWMFERFLQEGIAIAGVDVGESYGSPKGRAIYSALYRELVANRGLAQRACLLARSRGGLMLYNWACEHPSSVACIAGIYPVCDLKSYPGLKRACDAYDMTEQQLAAAIKEHNPIDRLEELAKARAPIFHIHGDRDRVVPVEKHSAELHRRYTRLGGPMTLRIVPGQGHNLWSGWFQSRELVEVVIDSVRPVSSGIRGKTARTDGAERPSGKGEERDLGSESALVARYALDEGGGTAVRDSSRTNDYGEITGAVWVRGNDGSALDFGGVADHVVCQNEPSSRIRGAMTVMAWVRSSSEARQYVLGRGRDWYLALDPGAVPVFTTRGSGSGGKLTPLRAGEAVPLNQWVMITGVYDTDRGLVSIYVDDRVSGTIPKTDGSIGGIFRSMLLLGHETGRPTENGLNGLMGEVRLYTRALTAKEIGSIHRATRPSDAIGIPTCRLRLTLRLFPCEQKVHAQLDLRKPYPEDSMRVQVSLLEVETRRALAKAAAEDITPAAPQRVREFDLSELEPGEYEVRAEAFSATDALLATVGQPFSLPKKRQWRSSRSAPLDEVPEPWTPLVVSRGKAAEEHLPSRPVEVSSWGRIYRFRESVFPEHIVTAGHAILAAPIRVSGRTGQGPLKWGNSTATVDEQTDARVAVSVKASDPELRLAGRATVEFDGMIRIDCALEPTTEVRLEELTVEIPFGREHAQLVYYYRDKLLQAPGSLPPARTARPFSPAIWLGTEEYGLQWFTESDRNWYSDSASEAIEIVPEGDSVVLRLNLVTKSITLAPGARRAESSAPELTYTFGLQATPVKPTMRDAWDLRIVPSSQYRLLGKQIAGEPALDCYSEMGARTVFLTSNWTDIFGYPGCVGHEAELRQMVKRCHELDMKVIVYLGSYLGDIAPESRAHVQDFAMWHTPYPYLMRTYRTRTQNYYLTCNGSDSWREFVLAGAERLMDEFEVDGFYLDGIGAAGVCHNVHHGCGYVATDGSIAPTYPLFECRDFLRRLHAIVKSRKPEGILDFHAGAYRMSPIVGWADMFWDGEAILGPIKREDRKKRFLTEYLPLDHFRAQFLGRGIAAEFLGYTVPYPQPRLWAMTLLHDIPVRPISSFGNVRFASRVWGVMDAFDRKGADWLPYWRNHQYVSVQPADACVSLYCHPENGALAVVSNLGRKRERVEVACALDRLGLLGEPEAIDALADERVRIENGRIAVNVDSVDFKLIWIRGRVGAERLP